MAANSPEYLMMEEAEKPLDWKHYLFLVQKNAYIILTFLIIALTLAAIYASKISDRFQTSTQIMIEKPEGVTQVSNYGEEGPEAVSWGEDYYNTQIEIMRSPTVLNQVVRELRLKDYYAIDNEEVISDRVRSMMQIKRIGTSRLFNIFVTAEEPKLTASIANAIARAYIRKNFEDTLYYSKEILAWLPQQGSLQEKISIQDPFGKMQQISREELIESLPVIQTDETLRALKEKKAALDSDLELLLKQYREKHPVVIRARSNLKFINDSVDAERARIIDNLKTQAEGRHRLGAARIIEEARLPKGPLPSNRIKIVAAAGIGALFLSILVIFLLDYFDDTIHSLEDFERKGLVNLPFLGPIPFVKGKVIDPEHRALAGYYAKQSNIAEAFRYLRVAINFSASPEALKTLVLSSSLPHEGKSFVSHNLAISLAMDGNRTLVVDADLRRPTLHNTFRVENNVGLSNFLTSKIDLDSVLKESFIENLTLVTSGPVSPNPGEILGSERMKEFLKLVRERYDRVIIDCPPLTGIGDAYVVGAMIGQIIMVIGANKTPADLIKHTQKNLDKAGVRIMGVVLNMVDIEKERHAGYSKHYYQTYNRYYSAANDDDDRPDTV